MNWIGRPEISREVEERSFLVTCQGRRVPGVLWTAPDPIRPAPLVLLGHGGSGHKRQDYILAQARRLVRRHGMAAAAIDGPVHGDRAPAGGGDARARRAAFRDSAVTDAMIADWRATTDALQKLDEIREGAIGYWGLSMGTLFGLPFVAAEPRVAASVLGLMGSFPEDGGRMERDAAALRCPVLFLVQWDDELIARPRALALFDAIGSDDKRLHANPGIHTAVPAAEFEGSREFLAQRLA